MRKPTNSTTVFLVLATMLATSAAMAAPGDSTALADTSWVLSDLPGHSRVPDGQPTLHFEDGQVHGSDGCNRYRAPYTLEAGGFRLSGEMVSTRMACPEPVMQQAAAFVDALARARAAQVDDGRLVLLDGDGVALATLTAQNRGLAGTSWEVTGYNNGRQAVVSLHADSTLTMSFSADGRVTGSAGCNRYTAAYSASGRGIGIDKVAATRRVCARPEGVMEQEAAFLQALERVAEVRLDGDRLELRAADGALQVTARRSAEAPTPAGEERG